MRLRRARAHCGPSTSTGLARRWGAGACTATGALSCAVSRACMSACAAHNQKAAVPVSLVSHVNPVVAQACGHPRRRRAASFPSQAVFPSPAASGATGRMSRPPTPARHPTCARA